MSIASFPRIVLFPHEIGHIVSGKHAWSDDASNLAYWCMICNRNKGGDIASPDWRGRLARLFNPREDGLERSLSA